jgi:cyclopropane-fatty-acyl-phospholipid synthase
MTECARVFVRYPKATITAISNSKTQKQYIDECASSRGIVNLAVKTQDVVTADFEKEAFDRVVSVEMFEHMKNYRTLLRRISSWLRPGGLCFVHIFVHQKGLPFHYLVESEDDWMTKYFFAGGQTPSADLLLHFQDDLSILKQWYVNGVHYSKTLEDWLVRHTTSKAKILPLFEQTYGQEDALKWYVYWRLFYLACSEFFAWENGERFGVGHYLFQKK